MAKIIIGVEAFGPADGVQRCAHPQVCSRAIFACVEHPSVSDSIVSSNVARSRAGVVARQSGHLRFELEADTPEAGEGIMAKENRYV